MQGFQADLGMLTATAASFDDLAAQADAAADAVSQAGSAMAGATGNPVAGGAVQLLSWQATDTIEHVAHCLRDDAARLRQTVGNYRQADQHGASVARSILAGL